LRSDQRRARREAAVALDGAQHLEPQFTTVDEGQQMLAAAVERLPNEQREVVILKIWSELTFAEIGHVLEISQNTAASRYRYALGALKKILQPMSDFAELETELKKLRPAPVPAGLLARVERALAQPAAVPTAGLLPEGRSAAESGGRLASA
jgi:hypothetical protein